MPGDLLYVSPKYILCGPSARESGLRVVLLGRHSLPFIFMALPHSLLPLRRGFPTLLQVSIRTVHTVHIIVCFRVSGAGTTSGRAGRKES